MTTPRQQALAAFLDVVPRLQAEIAADRRALSLHSGDITPITLIDDCRQIIVAAEGLLATAKTARDIMGSGQ